MYTYGNNMSTITKSILKRNPHFRTFFVADTFGKIADSYFLLLLPFLLKDLTQTGFALGLALATNALTKGLVSFYGGVLADRFEPQKILAWHNFAQMLTLVFFSYLLYSDQQSTYVVFLISAMFGILDGFASPASTSAAAKIVDRKDLLEANSYTQGLEQLTAIIGPVCAGLVTAKFGMLSGVIGGVVLYGLSTIFFGLIYKQTLVQHTNLISQMQPLQQIKYGLKIARKNSIVKISMLILLLNNLFITGPAVIGLVLLYEKRFELGADIYAYSGVLFSFGFLIGVFLVKCLIAAYSPSKLLLCIYFLYGVCLIGIGFAPNL
jgi:MFS transporter, DHA3 family, macrolide efflux protein